ncbi:putative polyvalent protein kinase domain-containing protein [Chitinophaga ginsengisegetis]|uniref:putative polyvalent protein kinase domain-containing protein n=1 Tax=Chitinophaga ginsengisegetis TaxID=393003 RepID=UPI000DBA2BF9|nr:hypothetical protein [Chitinophaga ginsengisegetis]MDR6567393.1 hypothetical protein [Chitinophaga ginsengisegetis]MDR6647124.1 hypothetical protein [Chitinophaga ginsengisegetis]MDR6653473.1 hypothetical protein [Chitinophaga ginsengisegetis]
MISDEIRQKLQNIIRGDVLKGQEDHCTAIRNLLVQSFGSSPTVKGEFEGRSILKEKQALFLKTHAENNGWWLTSLPKGSQYLTHGGESKIYLAPDHRHVIKINDAVYYATWLEYFNSLVIHNILFPNTAYELIGITSNKDVPLYVVLKQPFIEGGQADLAEIKEHLTFNGFLNTRRQDYFNEEFGLILEDMHDENVIAKNDVLFFIDTVFYIIAKKLV